MSITKEQKAALQAAGYTVKGNTVMAKDGRSVGGYNDNGKIWSGSDKVRSILKSPSTPQKTPVKPASTPPSKKVPAKKQAPVTKDAMAGYRKGDVTTSKIPKGGRGDGAAERVRRAADAALTKTAAPAPKKEKRIPGRALWRAIKGGGQPRDYMKR
jgi:hypothetical protein